jgi:hypothetical protein
MEMDLPIARLIKASSEILLLSVDFLSKAY